MITTEHWWQCDTNQGWHYYSAYDGLAIDAVINRLRSVLSFRPTDFSIISDVEFYMYAFDDENKDRLVLAYHFKRCIDP